MRPGRFGDKKLSSPIPPSPHASLHIRVAVSSPPLGSPAEEQEAAVVHLPTEQGYHAVTRCPQGAPHAAA